MFFEVQDSARGAIIEVDVDELSLGQDLVRAVEKEHGGNAANPNTVAAIFYAERRSDPREPIPLRRDSYSQ